MSARTLLTPEEKVVVTDFESNISNVFNPLFEDKWDEDLWNRSVGMSLHSLLVSTAALTSSHVSPRSRLQRETRSRTRHEGLQNSWLERLGCREEVLPGRPAAVQAPWVGEPAHRAGCGPQMPRGRRRHRVDQGQPSGLEGRQGRRRRILGNVCDCLLQRVENTHVFCIRWCGVRNASFLPTA